MWPYSISRVSSVLDDHVEKHRLCRSCERKIQHLDHLGPQPCLPVLRVTSTKSNWLSKLRTLVPPYSTSSSTDLLVFIIASLLAALQLAALCAADLLVELSSWELKVKVWKDGQCWRVHEFDPTRSLYKYINNFWTELLLLLNILHHQFINLRTITHLYHLALEANTLPKSLRKTSCLPFWVPFIFLQECSDSPGFGFPRGRSWTSPNTHDTQWYS